MNVLGIRERSNIKFEQIQNTLEQTQEVVRYVAWRIVRIIFHINHKNVKI